jgi:hypothetical protein
MKYSRNAGKRFGWIKLHRSLPKHPRFIDPAWLAVWVYLLLNATHRHYLVNFDGHIVELQPGQLVTGRHAIARATGVHESKVKRVLAVMKADRQIDQLTGVKGSIVTVRNWKLYQGDRLANQRATNNRPTTTIRTAGDSTGKHGAKRPIGTGRRTPRPKAVTNNLPNDKGRHPRRVTTNKKTRRNKNEHTHSLRRAPCLKEVNAEAARIEMPKGEAEKFFHHFNARGWVDRHGNPIAHWRSLLRTWIPDGGGVQRSTTRKASGTPTKKSPSLWELKTTLEAVEAALKQLRKSGPSIYASPEDFGKWLRTPGGQKYKAMKARRDHLQEKLAAAAV